VSNYTVEMNIVYALQLVHQYSHSYSHCCSGFSDMG